MANLLKWLWNTVKLTSIGRHLLGTSFAFHIVLTINNIATIIVKNAHSRVMAAFLELVLYLLNLVDAIYENTLLQEEEEVKLFTLVLLVIMTGLTVLELLVHS